MRDPVTVVDRVTAIPTILRMLTESTGLRLSLVAHVTDDTWTCCAVNDALQFGLEQGGHLDVSTTLCAEVRQARAPIVISHASADAVYCTHPTPKLYAFESYIAVPIFLSNGEYFGNVCALDSRPIPLGDKELMMFRLFAELIGRQLDAELAQAVTTKELSSERETSALREQFIAVLGHDARTPLSAITLAAEALATEPLSPTGAAMVARISRGARRIRHLVNEVLDFAHGRLGDGVPVRTTLVDRLDRVFQDVIDELRVVHPTRDVAIEIEPLRPAQVDADRLGQVLQNLLGNALVHSPPDAQVSVRVIDDHDALVVTVANGGPKISAEVMGRMFQPFTPGTRTNGGLGLGLYIASQIVRAHRGTIDVRSDEALTTVRCRIPRVGAGS